MSALAQTNTTAPGLAQSVDGGWTWEGLAQRTYAGVDQSVDSVAVMSNLMSQGRLM